MERNGGYCALGSDEMKSILTKDNICAFSLGIALLACIITGYNDNVACTIAGSLGGVITGKMIAGGDKNGIESSKKS
jgi:hypothetical protein